MNEFERTCKYNDMLFEIEEVITNCCQDKYSEYVDDAINILTDVYECRKDCDVTIVDICIEVVYSIFEDVVANFKE